MARWTAARCDDRSGRNVSKLPHRLRHAIGILFGGLPLNRAAPLGATPTAGVEPATCGLELVQTNQAATLHRIAATRT